MLLKLRSNVDDRPRARTGSSCCLGAFARSVVGAVILLLTARVLAEEPAGPRSHGLLEQLSRETQGLYEQVQGGMVRLQLPPPKWLNEVAARDNPVDKWGTQLAAQVKDQLERERQGVQQGKYNVVKAQVTSSPATPPRAGDQASW